MSEIIKLKIEDEMATIELENGTILILLMERSDGGCEITFYKDKDLELHYPGASFAFTDESYCDEDEDDNFYNQSEGLSYLLRAMDVPGGLEQMGIGEFIVKWVQEVLDANIWARNPADGKIGDGSDLTEQGRAFVEAMQEKGLIQNWD